MTTQDRSRLLGQAGAAPDWGHKLGLTDLWTEVVPDLWVGGTADDDTVDYARASGLGLERQIVAGRVTKADFDAVCTLYAWAQPADWGVTEYRYGFMDGALDPSERAELYAAADWVGERLGRNQRVLVRCQAGLNRSSLIAGLALVRSFGYSAELAITAIRRRSPKCLFNEAFEAFLIDEEARR